MEAGPGGGAEGRVSAVGPGKDWQIHSLGVEVTGLKG